MTLEPGTEIELTIDSLATGGDGIGRLAGVGVVVFVPGAAPGDRLRCRVGAVSRRFLRAELLEVLSPGPGRRESPCAYSVRCGGCDWLHLDEAVQSEARRQFLRDALQRIGGFASIPEIEWLASPDSLGYRALARVALDSGAIGFRARRSHEVVDIDHCRVLAESTQAALSELREAPPPRTAEVEIRGFEGEAAGLRASTSAFVQANQSLWQAWPACVAELCGSGSLLVELYAGIGFFTVALEKRFERTVAVERSHAAADLRHNTRAEVHQLPAEKFATQILPELSPDAVLLNPPRVGCDPSVIDAVAARNPERVVYVSCDAATLARDLKRLGAGFELKRVVSIDALPQTSHVEALVRLDRV